jgi:hypothetical protein
LLSFEVCEIRNAAWRLETCTSGRMPLKSTDFAGVVQW